jgi:hypothetical protein
MSLGVMLLLMIPGLNLLFVVWCLAAGWAAVLLYRRITGAALTVSAGAMLGSITGVLTFVSITALMAISLPFISRQQLDELVKQTPQMDQLIKDPVTLGMATLIGLLMFFALIVGTCAAGGALGARFAARNSNA